MRIVMTNQFADIRQKSHCKTKVFTRISFIAQPHLILPVYQQRDEFLYKCWFAMVNHAHRNSLAHAKRITQFRIHLHAMELIFLILRHFPVVLNIICIMVGVGNLYFRFNRVVNAQLLPSLNFINLFLMALVISTNKNGCCAKIQRKQRIQLLIIN